MAKITWLSHATWLIETGDHRILLDPFLTDNPAATVTPADLEPISHVLISHGHFDHVADAAEIANRDGATLIAIFEIAQWFSQQHKVANTIGMNLGGSTRTPWGAVKMTPALHSSQLPDGSYGGEPAGFMLTIEDKRIYFACDTALFSDMKLYAYGADVAVLPIGDLFTMGIDDSVAATKLLQPARVAPTHYNTWPPIEQDAELWAEQIRQQTSAIPITLKVGESFEL